MSSRQSNGTGVSDGSLRNSEAEDSSSSKGSQSADGEKELFDRERFPDRFYPGVIVLLDRVRGRGVIRAYSGREIRFEFPFVNVVGAALGGRAPGIELLREGDRVGFDVGWTSKGLRVTTLKPASRQSSEREG
jgi:hypothetical protein